MRAPPNPAMYHAFLDAAHTAVERGRAGGLVKRVINVLQRNAALASR